MTNTLVISFRDGRTNKGPSGSKNKRARPVELNNARHASKLRTFHKPRRRLSRRGLVVQTKGAIMNCTDSIEGARDLTWLQMAATGGLIVWAIALCLVLRLHISSRIAIARRRVRRSSWRPLDTSCAQS